MNLLVIKSLRYKDCGYIVVAIKLLAINLLAIKYFGYKLVLT